MFTLGSIRGRVLEMAGAHAEPRPQPGCGGEGCSYARLEYQILRAHGVSELYACTVCGRWHICDGGDECRVVIMGDGLVCALTGSFLGEDYREGARTGGGSLTACLAREEELDSFTFAGVVTSIKAELVVYFTLSAELKDVTRLVVIQDQLAPGVSAMIDHTFPLCRHLLEEINCGYQIICSMYVHIIISIYANKTVYDALLFKCTRNKKLDAILKQMRERWMSIITTHASSLENAAP